MRQEQPKKPLLLNATKIPLHYCYTTFNAASWSPVSTTIDITIYTDRTRYVTVSQHRCIRERATELDLRLKVFLFFHPTRRWPRAGQPLLPSPTTLPDSSISLQREPSRRLEVLPRQHVPKHERQPDHACGDSIDDAHGVTRGVAPEEACAADEHAERDEETTEPHVEGAKGNMQHCLATALLHVHVVVAGAEHELEGGEAESEQAENWVVLVCLLNEQSMD